jgi:DNA-directed RNA polymerase subunit RPC12/RpoP
VFIYCWWILAGKEDKSNKVCIDCGKRFDSVNQIDSNKGQDVVICTECVALLKKRFWNSMKMEMKKNTSSNVFIQEEQGKV